MNIHKSQLFWCELQGYYWFWHTAICLDQFLGSHNYILSHWKLALEIIETSLGSSWLLGWSQVNTIDSAWQCCLAVSSSQVLGILPASTTGSRSKFTSLLPLQMHAKCICRIWSWPQLCLVCWWSRPSYPRFQFSESCGSPKMDPNFNATCKNKRWNIPWIPARWPARKPVAQRPLARLPPGLKWRNSCTAAESMQHPDTHTHILTYVDMMIHAVLLCDVYIKM